MILSVYFSKLCGKNHKNVAEKFKKASYPQAKDGLNTGSFRGYERSAHNLQKGLSIMLIPSDFKKGEDKNE